MSIFANIKAMKDVQKIKNGGKAQFSISAIVNLTINLPDAEKTLERTAFDQVFALFKQMNKCSTKMELDYEGYISTAADILREFDKIAPCESYLGMEPFEAMMVMNEVRKTRISSQKKPKNDTNSGVVNIFHIARNLDGTIQPIVAASIYPNDTELVKALLCTDNLGVDEISHHDMKHFYYFLYDKNTTNPHPSVILLKFNKSTDGTIFLDMGQEDMPAVTYAIDAYLHGKTLQDSY